MNLKGSHKRISNLKGIRLKIAIIWKDQINRNKVIVSELDIKVLGMSSHKITVLNIRRIRDINQSIHNHIEIKVRVKVILEEKCLVENL